VLKPALTFQATLASVPDTRLWSLAVRPYDSDALNVDLMHVLELLILGVLVAVAVRYLSRGSRQRSGPVNPQGS
jgi:hypothetical protein